MYIKQKKKFISLSLFQCLGPELSPDSLLSNMKIGLYFM